MYEEADAKALYFKKALKEKLQENLFNYIHHIHYLRVSKRNRTFATSCHTSANDGKITPEFAN